MPHKDDGAREAGAADAIERLAEKLAEAQRGADAQLRALGEQVVAELRHWRQASSRQLTTAQARTELEFRALTSALGHGGPSPILAGSTVDVGELTLRHPLPQDAERVEAFDAAGARLWWVDGVGGLDRIHSHHVAPRGVDRVVVLDDGGRPLLLTYPTPAAAPPGLRAGI